MCVDDLSQAFAKVRAVRDPVTAVGIDGLQLLAHQRPLLRTQTTQPVAQRGNHRLLAVAPALLVADVAVLPAQLLVTFGQGGEKLLALRRIETREPACGCGCEARDRIAPQCLETDARGIDGAGAHRLRHVICQRLEEFGVSRQCRAAVPGVELAQRGAQRAGLLVVQGDLAGELEVEQGIHAIVDQARAAGGQRQREQHHQCDSLQLSETHAGAGRHVAFTARCPCADQRVPALAPRRRHVAPDPGSRTVACPQAHLTGCRVVGYTMARDACPPGRSLPCEA